jgi:hypothetical protein
MAKKELASNIVEKLFILCLRSCTSAAKFPDFGFRNNKILLPGCNEMARACTIHLEAGNLGKLGD